MTNTADEPNGPDEQREQPDLNQPERVPPYEAEDPDRLEKGDKPSETKESPLRDPDE